MKIVAYKNPAWTGKIVEVSLPGDDRPPFRVKLDGLTIGNGLTGRVVGRPRERWFFEGLTRGEPGLPPWAVIVEEPQGRRVTKSALSASTSAPVSSGQWFRLEMGPTSVEARFDRVSIPEDSVRRMGDMEIWHQPRVGAPKKFMMLRVTTREIATSWYAENVVVEVGDSIVVAGKNVGADDHVFRGMCTLTLDESSPMRAPFLGKEERKKLIEKIKALAPADGDVCPDCGAPLRAKGMDEGGGVVCTKCDWWFCF